MCGRYSTGTEFENIRFKERLEELFSEGHGDNTLELCAEGDIHPGDSAPVICTIGSNLRFETMKWGFNFDGKLVFNARSESAAVKPAFKNSVKTMRCIVPALGYYEWNSKKEKHFFSDPDGELLLMAGLYRIGYDGKSEYTVLTRDSYGPVSDIHDRMPLIMRSWKEWLLKPSDSERLLASGDDIKLDISCMSPQQISMF